MIIGIGTDIVDIRRIEKSFKRFGTRFEARVFSAKERAQAKKIKDTKKRLAFFAKRFAAKEAFAKALGSGIGERVAFSDISVENDAAGKPAITLSKAALTALKLSRKRPRIHLSLSDEYPYAQAFVIVEI